MKHSRGIRVPIHGNHWENVRWNFVLFLLIIGRDPQVHVTLDVLWDPHRTFRVLQNLKSVYLSNLTWPFTSVPLCFGSGVFSFDGARPLAFQLSLMSIWKSSLTHHSFFPQSGTHQSHCISVDTIALPLEGVWAKDIWALGSKDPRPI